MDIRLNFIHSPTKGFCDKIA